MINLLTDKEDGGVSVLGLAGCSSEGMDGGLVQVRPGMFSGSSSNFTGMPGVNDGLSSMIVWARSFILPLLMRLMLVLIFVSDCAGVGDLHISWNLSM